jgi:hypothetical protein
MRAVRVQRIHGAEKPYVIWYGGLTTGGWRGTNMKTGPKQGDPKEIVWNHYGSTSTTTLGEYCKALRRYQDHHATAAGNHSDPAATEVRICHCHNCRQVRYIATTGNILAHLEPGEAFDELCELVLGAEKTRKEQFTDIMRDILRRNAPPEEFADRLSEAVRKVFGEDVSPQAGDCVHPQCQEQRKVRQMDVRSAYPGDRGSRPE